MKFAKCEMCGSTGLFMSHLKPKVKLFFHEFVLSHLSRLPIGPVFFFVLGVVGFIQILIEHSVSKQWVL